MGRDPRQCKDKKTITAVPVFCTNNKDGLRIFSNISTTSDSAPDKKG